MPASLIFSQGNRILPLRVVHLSLMILREVIHRLIRLWMNPNLLLLLPLLPSIAPLPPCQITKGALVKALRQTNRLR